MRVRLGPLYRLQCATLCAERRLLGFWIHKAHKHNVKPHNIVTWVRRKAGTELCVWRPIANGTSLGCSFPCFLCRQELLQFGLRVHCLTPDGKVYSGDLTEPDAPASKATRGQQLLLGIGLSAAEAAAQAASQAALNAREKEREKAKAEGLRRPAGLVPIAACRRG